MRLEHIEKGKGGAGHELENEIKYTVLYGLKSP